MGNMEVQLLSQNSLRIKSKRASFVVDPHFAKASNSAKATSDKPEGKSPYVAAIALARPLDELNIQADAVGIDRPGEYEIGGIKMNATRGEAGIVFSPVVEGVEILLGKLTTLEKMQHKLKEQHMVIIYADAAINASFISSFASNVVIFYGEYAKEAASSLGKDTVQSISKYAVTLEKLPQEVETIILE